MMRLTTALFVMLASPGLAYDPSWPDIRATLFEDRPLTEAGDMISLDMPYRTANDARTDIAGYVQAPARQLIGRISVIIDENPMPVSAVFDFEVPVPRFFFDVTMRINGPTPVHVVAETTDGQLFVADGFVKTSGLGACSAPPGTDPELALASLGEMDITVGGLSGTGPISTLIGRERRMDLDISHPSHSGMQKDQISLLFIPMRYVEDVQIDLDQQGFVDFTGSISLSENPRLGLSIPNSAQSVDVTMTDTDGTVATLHKDLPNY